MKVLFTDPSGDLALERELLGAALAGPDPAADGVEVLVVHQTIVDAACLARYPNLKGVVRLGVGFDKVDLAACAAQGVRVANVPDYCTGEVADTAMAMILDLVRGVHELEAALRQSPAAWQSLSLARVRRSAALVLGVVGAGRIGRAVLERAAGFGFTRIFCDPAVAACAGAERVERLETLLARADIVSLHVPLNPATRGLIDAGFLARMKPGALLVNTARGGLLADQQALLEALAQGRLAGAAFDVLPIEPPLGQPLFEAWRQRDPSVHGRLILNPHNAFYSQEAAQSVRRLACEEAIRMLAGQPLRHPVSDAQDPTATSFSE
ncbi:MAG TPA: C-terminal binding protein [Candidatus Obscuribacterales bacterium]